MPLTMRFYTAKTQSRHFYEIGLNSLCSEGAVDAVVMLDMHMVTPKKARRTVMPNEQKIEIEGGCTCGSLRYRLTAPPLFVHCCHCTRCQRETGSAFAVNALIETSAVKLLQGQLRETLVPSASGKGQVIFRCFHCGGAVWSSYGIVRASILVIHVGTLDDPTAAPPDIHIFTSTKQPWVILPNGVPTVSEYYHHSEYWPTESIERYKAVRP